MLLHFTEFVFGYFKSLFEIFDDLIGLLNSKGFGSDSILVFFCFEVFDVKLFLLQLFFESVNKVFEFIILVSKLAIVLFDEGVVLFNPTIWRGKGLFLLLWTIGFVHVFFPFLLLLFESPQLQVFLLNLWP